MTVTLSVPSRTFTDRPEPAGKITVAVAALLAVPCAFFARKPKVVQTAPGGAPAGQGTELLLARSAMNEPSAFRVMPAFGVPAAAAVSGTPSTFLTLPSTPGGALA